MTADAFRYLYEYHFAENRKLWNWFVSPLTDEQFTQAADESEWSVRDQVVHLMEVDDVWFSEVQNLPPLDAPPDDADRSALRAYGDAVEQRMRGYLAGLQDEALSETPIQEPDEDRDLIVWQVLFHVLNHGTDHRAQTLKAINDLGIRTPPQDFIFYVYERKEGEG